MHQFWRKSGGGTTNRMCRLRVLKLENLEERRVMAVLPFGAVEADLGEFMLGSVAVTPVFLESNGAIDVSTEDWTSVHIEEVLANIETGLDWWVETLASMSSIHELSFTIDTTHALTPFETSYEGISRRSNDYTLYVEEFLTGVGFQSGGIESNIRSFNQSQREKLGTDWSFTIFVVPSQNDADGQFAAGGSFRRAFAFAGGLFMVVPSTRPASTFTHETGHMFWARDEYAGGGTFFSRRGYYNTQNINAADNPTPGFVQQPSIMAAGTLLQEAYDNNHSPASTLAMLGWQDSDGNGIFDVLDVPHRLTGTGYLDIETGTYRFMGEAVVQTLPNLNSSGLRNDITLNKIREIQARFDGGEWATVATPDVYEATLDLTIAVPSGVSQIELRARDSRTTVVSNTFVGRLARADATLVPGINGFVWIDKNKNGLRDLGEDGVEGWAIEVSDAQGNPLSLSGQIEPDDYADGVLASDFRTDLTVRVVGADSDGRVAVFPDTGASTGTKTFRGFSLGSQTFLSNWTPSSRRLQIDFSSPTSAVSIDAIGPNANSFGRLEAYNASGQLLGRATTGRLANGEVETLALQRGQADIAYVIIGGHMNSSVKLDNFRFGPQLSLTTSTMGGYAIAGLPTGTYTVEVTPPVGFRALSGASTLVTVTAGQATIDADFGFETSVSLWQNPRDPLDVNDDMMVSPLDILLIINDINARGVRNLRGSGLSTPPFIDTSGDGIVSALDILRIINFLNQRAAGEAEGPDAGAEGPDAGAGPGSFGYWSATGGVVAAPPVSLTAWDSEESDTWLTMLAQDQLAAKLA